MSLRVAILIAWAAFWAYWLVAAVAAKQSVNRGRFRPPGLVVVLAFVLLRVFGAHTLNVRDLSLQVAGSVLIGLGLGVAVWARVYLGRNWGMPMTQKEEPQLVTSGPYRFVRHPIYSGLLLAILGTALATNIYWLIALGVLGLYFFYSAKVEERIMTSSFPDAYRSYRARTKMLIPFLL